MPSEAFERLYELFKEFPLTPNEGLEAMRIAYNGMADKFAIKDDIKFEAVDIDGVRAEMISAPYCIGDKIIMYLHGGAYVMGTIEMYYDMASRISRAAGIKVISVNYRLAPENKFPAGLDDSIAVYKWLLKKYSPKDIIIMGDSAGGGLTLATLLKIRSLALKMPLAAVCLSPWTDLAMTGKSIIEKAEVDPILNYDLLKYCADSYVGEDGDHCDPFVSPFYADLTGLPPILIMVGEREILLDDSMRFAKKAEFYGVDVTLVIAQEMTHVWSFFASVINEGQQAIEYIADYIQKRI